ncbi:MAG: LCP family protein [Candidatus Shapirobacteria bacterium]|nr:LCP family protein [Candidatus Shapirobacteria bacterium]
MQKKINSWWITAGILGILLIGFGIFYLTYNRMVVKKNKSISENINITPTATPTPDPLASYSILLLGYGGGIHEGGSTTDTIMVAKIDPRNEEISLISIPRDLWVQIPINGDETKSFKINAAYPIGLSDKQYPNKKTEFTGNAGGGELSKYIVEQVIGFKIDYFAAIDFDGFIKMIDILGGLDIKVEKTFDDPFYPIETNIDDPCGKTDEEMKSLEATMSGDKLEQQYTCRYENLHFDKGIQHMDGLTALKFARSRHSVTDGGDFNRAARQRLVVTAIRDKVISIGFVSKIIPTIKNLTSHITTDINFSKMNELVAKIPEIVEYKIIPIALTDENVLEDARATTGQAILSPKAGENNWDVIHQFIQDKGVATMSSAIKTKN